MVARTGLRKECDTDYSGQINNRQKDKSNRQRFDGSVDLRRVCRGYATRGLCGLGASSNSVLIIEGW